MAYFWQVCSVPYPVHHLLALGVDGGHMAPHPLPGDALDGETVPINVEENPSFLLLFLLGGVTGGAGSGLLPGAVVEQAVCTGALGAAAPAELGR